MNRSHIARLLGTLALFCVALLLFPLKTFAGDAPTECVDGESGNLLFTHEDVPGSNLMLFEPEMTGSGENGDDVRWRKTPSSTDETLRTIGNFHGNDISEVTYTDDDTTVSPQSPFTWAVFFYTVTVKGVSHTRPFFIVSGDDIYAPDFRFSATDTHPFSLVIDVMIPGTGAMHSTFHFDFSKRQAILIQRFSSARHSAAQQYEYNSAGKVTKVTTFDRE